MHVLSGSRTFRARQMSGGYMHPQKLPGMGMNFPQEGMCLPSHSPAHVTDSVLELTHVYLGRVRDAGGWYPI